MKPTDIPSEVGMIAQTLERKGFQAFLVGGCVRDLLRGTVHGEPVEPKDWDIATDAKPDKIQEIFPESVYENEFGTVGVKTDSPDAALKVIEVTTFRLEEGYADKRHPDEVKFARTVEEDLSRRDFTVNALAMRLDGEIIDPFHGGKDLGKKIIRAVGDPEGRFAEDALRLMRAVRFAAELGFSIEPETRQAIKTHAGLLEAIAKERIRDEFAKIVMAERAADGIFDLEALGLLRFILPELREGIEVSQERHHVYSVFEHSVRALEYAAKQKYPLEIRLAALLHDIGKPRTRREGHPPTFYNHEVVGARMAAAALDRLRFSRETAEKAVHLVRHHMFYYNVGEVSPAGVRRFLVRVGPEHVDDLIRVREADRIGSGVPKAVPYKLRHFLFMIEKVKHDPLSPKMLHINGADVMRILRIQPGPRVGQTLAILLEEVLDDPKRNTNAYLEKRTQELGALSDRELRSMMAKAKAKKEAVEQAEEEKIKRRYHVT